MLQFAQELLAASQDLPTSLDSWWRKIIFHQKWDLTQYFFSRKQERLGLSHHPSPRPGYGIKRTKMILCFSLQLLSIFSGLFVFVLLLRRAEAAPLHARDPPERDRDRVGRGHCRRGRGVRGRTHGHRDAQERLAKFKCLPILCFPLNSLIL